MTLPIREFAYLDSNKIEDFLSPFGGMPSQSSASSERKGPRTDVSAGIGPVGGQRQGGVVAFEDAVAEPISGPR